jgi:hypothetical protein
MEEFNFHRDSRTVAAMTSQPYKVLESNAAKTSVQLSESLLEGLIEDGILPEDSDGIYELDTKYEVCDCCRGSGSVVNPAIDAGGISREQFEEDPQFEADYFDGKYDITCPECEGKRVVPEVEFPASIRQEIASWMRAESDYAQTCAAERAMGA